MVVLMRKLQTLCDPCRWREMGRGWIKSKYHMLRRNPQSGRPDRPGQVGAGGKGSRREGEQQSQLWRLTLQAAL